MKKKLSWKPYNPAWLVELAKKAKMPAIAKALARSIKSAKGCPSYIYFVDPKNPNKPGSEWQFKKCVELKSLTEGELVLDVLEDGRIGGIEFLKKLCMDDRDHR